MGHLLIDLFMYYDNRIFEITYQSPRLYYILNHFIMHCYFLKLYIFVELSEIKNFIDNFFLQNWMKNFTIFQTDI